MKVSRRDLLIGSAGVTAGILFTPVPWKLLGDVSIWTQNWSWIPQPAHGPVETKLSACTLCPNGCGVRVRLAANCPVGIAGVNTHPLTRGALCPLAFAAHQLNWHPQRVREVRHRGRAASWAEAQAAFEKACSEGPIAIIDGQPGRAASSVLQSFAEKRNGSYRIAWNAESLSLAPYAEWSGVPVDALGYDLENARTIVSFGAPLLDGWGTPGRFTRLWAERAAGSADPQLRLIQIEPSFSRTAARAWQWIPIREGSDAALAAGVARVLMEEHLVKSPGPIPKIDPGRSCRPDRFDDRSNSRSCPDNGWESSGGGDCGGRKPSHRRVECLGRFDRDIRRDCQEKRGSSVQSAVCARPRLAARSAG